MPDLAAALAQVLSTRASASARAAAERLRDTYRSGAPPTALAIADAESAAAYAACRMPATAAALSRALNHDLPLNPTTHTDLGGGTGAAVWVVADRWPGVASTVVDASSEALALGETIARVGRLDARWERRRLGPNVSFPSADLTTISYLLGELDPADAEGVVTGALASSRAVLVVEPGTPRGYAAVLAARDRLRSAGWHLVAPCPHALDCPLADGDWCHFSVRVQRSNLHRDLKAAELNYEDEKFSYVLATRPGDPPQPPAAPADRVLRHPLTRKGLVQFRVCSPDGAAHDRIVSKRQGELYRQARDTRWGDTLPSQRT